LGKFSTLDFLIRFCGWPHRLRQPHLFVSNGDHRIVEISGDSATLHAYVMSQHFMPRQGPCGGSENALLMNRYDCELVRDGQKWRFKRVTIDNAWSQGDPAILNVLAFHRTMRAKSKQPK
jgi:hypothetical protein